MNIDKRRGNVILACLLAATVVVALAICLLPDGSAAANEPVQEAIAEAAEAADEDAEMAAEIEASTLVKEGDTAPDFTVEMLDGSKITLADLKGNVVLVNFWATWCPPCREELSHVQAEIIDRFADKPFRMIAISRGEQRAKVEKFIADNGYTFPVGLDPEQSIFGLFATNYIPRNFLIDAEGKVVFVGVGYDETEFAHLKNAIAETLKNI